MAYLFHTQQQQDDEAMMAIFGREKEHYNYELNRKNFLDILASEPYVSLPEDWPVNLEKYKLTGDSDKDKNKVGEVLAAELHGEDYNTVINLQFRDRIRLLLKTTIAEQAKCVAAMDVISKRIPQGPRFEAAKNRLQAKIDSGEV